MARKKTRIIYGFNNGIYAECFLPYGFVDAVLYEMYLVLCNELDVKR